MDFSVYINAGVYRNTGIYFDIYVIPEFFIPGLCFFSSIPTSDITVRIPFSQAVHTTCCNSDIMLQC